VFCLIVQLSKYYTGGVVTHYRPGGRLDVCTQCYERWRQSTKRGRRWADVVFTDTH